MGGSGKGSWDVEAFKRAFEKTYQSRRSSSSSVIRPGKLPEPESAFAGKEGWVLLAVVGVPMLATAYLVWEYWPQIVEWVALLMRGRGH